MEPHQDTTSNENPVDVEGSERVRSSSASSTSSTSSSEFQDPLQQNSFKKDNLPRKNSNEDQEKPEQEQRDSTLQSPPIQTMERPDNGSGYRIPSYVFARNKSGNPVEWSTTSNESLFSIHTGNTSFTGDKYSWLLEAADMYNLPDAEDSPDTQEVSAPQIQSPSSPDQVMISNPDKEEENLNTNDGIKPKSSTAEEQLTPASSRSNESGHSFAFLMVDNQLDGGGGSVKSVKSGLSSVPEKTEQQKDTQSSSSESNEGENPPPEAANPSPCNCFGSWMAYFTCRAKAEKDATASKD